MHNALCSTADDIETLRHSFRPDKITVLFVGESTPQGGTFFYHGNSQVFRYLKKALNGGEGFLGEFKAKGYFLDDLVLEPINHNTNAERRRLHNMAVPGLAERLATYRPLTVVSILKSIKQPVTEAIVRASISGIPHYSVAFPGTGQQGRFLEEIAEILPVLPGQPRVIS